MSESTAVVMRRCCLVSVKGHGDERIIERALSAAGAGDRLLVVSVGEADSLERLFADQCDFLHLLPGDLLFRHLDLVRRTLAYTSLTPAEQNEVTAAVIYGNLRYYYPVKSFLERGQFARLRVPAKVQPLAAERTVIAAAQALGLVIEENPA
jgi:hypothetical protein